MKIMTFNLRSDNILDIHNRWKKRKEIVYKVINKYQCDIIGLQEVTGQMEKDIKENMEAYQIFGEGRTKKLFLEKNNLLIKHNYPIQAPETFWLSSTPDRVGSSIWYSLFPRICTTAIVEVKPGVCVRVYNTHLDCLLPYAREYGLKKIAQAMEKYQKQEDLPCILMGDFNATPESKLIKNFKNGVYSNKHFIAVQEMDSQLYKESTMGMFKGKEKGMHIDYIFVSDDFNIKDVRIVRDNMEGKYPSDHYPIIADIEL
ncbi:endonuclease [Sporanaerobium hydrogeniformans]|uniref:Endonuclease n=1 Tax=Sporanaerobium hydrogeniformans TaxID=3072179 RepID=A0AC61D6T3_9FIRM|nr:endonuclease/exonuclease/phosphatase family protein [Sporanaerobium hydrogeniformans]PHV69394.1 endonuclease [Sporanaerobium hydrogeniformans]